MTTSSNSNDIRPDKTEVLARKHENMYIAVCLVFMAVDFAAANYVGNLLYGVPIIAMQIIVLKILAKRWGVEEHTDFSSWLPGSKPKGGSANE